MKLLIGYDGSQCANAALDDLRRAGLPREAQAIILSVFEQWLPAPIQGRALRCSRRHIRCRAPERLWWLDVLHGRGRMDVSSRPGDNTGL